MPTAQKSQTTDFSRDVLGRFICNGLDEALRSTDTNIRPDARPFDIIVIGGGSFGAVLAQRLFTCDKPHSHRILVLEGGPFVLPEHVQNLPVLGLNPPAPTSIHDLRLAGQDRAPRNEVWGLAWHGNQKFPGLAYCMGGRSVFWGGWSPQPIDTELPAARWPADVLTDLAGPLGAKSYFQEASELIGVAETNDFIHGPLHASLRGQLKAGMDAGQVRDAVPLAALPDHPAVRWGLASTTDGVRELLGMTPAPTASAEAAVGTGGLATSEPAVLGAAVPIPVGDTAPPLELRNLLKLEAPLAVETRTRSGFFPWNKFSSVPLLIQATRAAWSESQGDDVKKRLMLVPHCHVKRLRTANGRIEAVETNLGDVPVPVGGEVLIALGTIESARLALGSFTALPVLPSWFRGTHPEFAAEFDAWRAQIGRNLMGHLRSNLTIRFPRTALPIDPTVRGLQASALFVKCRHTHADGSAGHFHFQITAAGLGAQDADSEKELFKKVPDIETFDQFKAATDTHIVVTIRGIGEMAPQNPVSGVFLDSEPDEFGVPRANVTIAPTQKDLALWDAMDRAADDVAAVLAGGPDYETLVKQRDGLGTTHHEAGTLALGSVTDKDARLRFVDNAYAAGPALFPTVGSPNPMLTGVALARRLARHLVPPPVPYAPGGGFTALFDGFSTAKWRMAGEGGFRIVDAALESTAGGNDLGLYWCEVAMPASFVLKLEWRRWNAADNSGVFVRFPHPLSKGYRNPAYVAVHFGFEVQIDELAPNDLQRTGAIYNVTGQSRTPTPARPPGEWNEFEIRVQGQTYTVFLNEAQVTELKNTDPNRGKPSTTAEPSFVGLQSYPGSRVAFRNIRFKKL